MSDELRQGQASIYHERQQRKRGRKKKEESPESVSYVKQDGKVLKIIKSENGNIYREYVGRVADAGHLVK